MKKILARLLCVALVVVMGLAMLPAAEVSAAEDKPVLILRATDAINPLIDMYLFREDYGTGGPFKIEFEWKCTMSRGLDPTKQNTPNIFVGITGHDNTATKQVSPDYSMKKTTDWNKQSFTFNNVGFCLEPTQQYNLIRFGMWYVKGEMQIKNIKITNAAGQVVYDMNADPDIIQLMEAGEEFPTYTLVKDSAFVAPGIESEYAITMTQEILDGRAY